jgi:hypothetical protein
MRKSMSMTDSKKNGLKNKKINECQSPVGKKVEPIKNM